MGLWRLNKPVRLFNKYRNQCKHKIPVKDFNLKTALYNLQYSSVDREKLSIHIIFFFRATFLLSVLFRDTHGLFNLTFDSKSTYYL